MDAAASAVNKLLSKTGEKDTTVEQEVAPAVEHDTIVKEHETREQKVVDKEKHVDHYHTTVQPLEDREVQETKHDHEQAATEYRKINKDTKADEAQAQAAAEREKFRDTTDEGVTHEKKVNEGEVVGEQVHHHLHEVVQPVIEKEIVKPSVTHKTIPVKEVIQEQSQNHGVTRKEPISVDEFTHRLDGEKKTEHKVAGELPAEQ
ncbi:hypothetical protein CB0940_09354 [Cercospora beticola]|uniref:Allergen n=1 Tax=Cercospora beticola TaxID=122368 RepID=A0A2G5HHB8_CERBT|nr:hypothetical protein CB0940_09354 [Cercospora beticola]PIA91885.1 hypothetical protein CB0940_09354 [Cercospora beticola]WPB06331.1 hypothetical protein RHO25_010988 [Cercospora beticola]CAK1366222.1 unnamed protein product [Cercospora beticola]